MDGGIVPTLNFFLFIFPVRNREEEKALRAQRDACATPTVCIVCIYVFFVFFVFPFG